MSQPKTASEKTDKFDTMLLMNEITAPTPHGPETDPVVGAVNGIVKADGAGHIRAAVAGTDYLTPTGNGAGLTGVLTTLAGHTVSELANDAPFGVFVEQHEYEFYAAGTPAASGTIGHVTGSHGMLKIADGTSCWSDLPYLRQVAPPPYPSAYVVTGCGDASYNGIYQYRGIEPDGGSPYPSYELSTHRVLVFKPSAQAPAGWQLGQHNDGAPRYFVAAGGDPADPALGVWADDGVLPPFGQIRPSIGTGALSGILLADGSSGLRVAIPGTDYVATLAGVNVSSFANDAGYLTPNTTADGTYPVANDGVTTGQLASITIANGLITGVTVLP